jgi:hypothetical protein
MARTKTSTDAPSLSRARPWNIFLNTQDACRFGIPTRGTFVWGEQSLMVQVGAKPGRRSLLFRCVRLDVAGYASLTYSTPSGSIGWSPRVHSITSSLASTRGSLTDVLFSFVETSCRWPSRTTPRTQTRVRLSCILLQKLKQSSDRSLQRSHAVQTEPFTDVFGPGAHRKRPRIDTSSSKELRKLSDAAVEGGDDIGALPQPSPESDTSTPLARLGGSRQSHRLVQRCAAHLRRTRLARGVVSLDNALYAQDKTNTHKLVALRSIRSSSAPRRLRARPAQGDGNVLRAARAVRRQPPPPRRAGDRGRCAASGRACAFRSSQAVRGDERRGHV